MSNVKQLEELLTKINEIRTKKLLTYEQLAEQTGIVMREMREYRENFIKEPVHERLDVIKFTGVIKSYSNEKAMLSEQRQMLAQLHTEESRLLKEYYELKATE
jgi:hypothetical protein